MSFYVFFLVGVLGGVLGGMGMGGGTLLIPLLTIFCGVPQAAAQGVNLLSFVPMSLLALAVHQKNGRIEKSKIAWLSLPALVVSGATAFAAGALPSGVLKKGFGFFLIALSAFPFFSAFKKSSSEKNSSEN